MAGILYKRGSGKLESLNDITPNGKKLLFCQAHLLIQGKDEESIVFFSKEYYYQQGADINVNFKNADKKVTILSELSLFYNQKVSKKCILIGENRWCKKDNYFRRVPSFDCKCKQLIK